MRKFIRNSESTQRTHHASVHVSEDLIPVLVIIALVCNMVFVEGNSLFRSWLCGRLTSTSVMMWVMTSIISGLQCANMLMDTWLVPPGVSIWVWHKSGLVLSWGHPGERCNGLFGSEHIFLHDRLVVCPLGNDTSKGLLTPQLVATLHWLSGLRVRSGNGRDERVECNV